MSIECLTLLNAKTSSFEGGRGGKPTLTGIDIAQALGRMPRIYANILRLKVAGQEESIWPIYRLLLAWLHEQAKEKVWDIRKPEFVAGTAAAVISEWCDDRCPRCKGRGELRNKQGVARACDKCDGTGRHPKTVAARARAANIDEDNFRKVWSPRFDLAMDWLRLNESQALDGFKWALK
jgi:hypothetical protein